MTSSLVGSEMCIRDRHSHGTAAGKCRGWHGRGPTSPAVVDLAQSARTVSYTHLTLPTICSV
eukprot:11476336-Prorocentrum_lima.AAC.1